MYTRLRSHIQHSYTNINFYTFVHVYFIKPHYVKSQNWSQLLSLLCRLLMRKENDYKFLAFVIILFSIYIIVLVHLFYYVQSWEINMFKLKVEIIIWWLMPGQIINWLTWLKQLLENDSLWTINTTQTYYNNYPTIKNICNFRFQKKNCKKIVIWAVHKRKRKAWCHT